MLSRATCRAPIRRVKQMDNKYYWIRCVAFAKHRAGRYAEGDLLLDQVLTRRGLAVIALGAVFSEGCLWTQMGHLKIGYWVGDDKMRSQGAVVDQNPSRGFLGHCLAREGAYGSLLR